MRKILTLLVVALLLSSSLLAQKKRWGYFGLKTGLNISSIKVDDSDESLESKYKTGFVLGGFIKIPVSANFSIQPELLYSSMGGNIDDGIDVYHFRLNYFSIPVLAKFNFCKNKWAALIGPQVDFMIQAKEGGEKLSSSLFAESNFLATAGLEFWPCSSIVIGARYQYGISNALNDENTDSKWKNHGAQVTIGFPLVK
jgi:hypothetical protein